MNAIRHTVISTARAITVCLMLSVPMMVLFEGMEPPAKPATDAELLETRGHAKGSQAWAVEKSGCVVAPEGVIGSSVIYDVPLDGKGWRVGGELAVGDAFEQLVFDGVLEANEWTQPVDHGMTVGVFCK